MWKKLFILALAALALAVLVLGLYTWHLSREVEERFAVRRWSIPSRVYAEPLLLYPGLSLTQDQFLARLRSLDYQRVGERPRQPGQYLAAGPGVEVWLREMVLPERRREAMAVRLVFGQGQITSLEKLADGQGLPLLELEPEEIAQFFGPQREMRQLISLAEAPPQLVHAVLAAEDADFYSHHGLDPLGILRAAWVNFKAGTIRQGGSTLTQQLAKSYFLTQERTLARKVKETLIALALEARYDKDTILEIYLNEIYLGQKGSAGVNGMGEAARFYFGRTVGELSPAQAATLAGLIKSPGSLSPHRHPQACLARRDQVLGAMARHGWLAEQELAQALKEPLAPAAYTAYGRKAPWFLDHLSQQLADLYPPSALASLGLAIHTTLDLGVQAAAEKALETGLARLEKAHPKLRREKPEQRLQGAIIVMQPKTGHILAMVGGRDYGQSQFNRAVQARRQPGSTFKPIVYLAGLEAFTPASLLSNEARTYHLGGQAWSPQNYDGHSGGQVRARTALARSLNLPTVDLAMRLGLDRVLATARALGLPSTLEAVPSLALGAGEVTPLELARAYCALAAEGLLPYPLALRQVASEKGRVLERRHVDLEAATTPAKAFLISSMLTSTVAEGTARALPGLGVTFPLAAKTGTTNDYRDAWFVGYTPEVLALVWVGFDDNESTGLTGAGAAMPIWADLMKAIPWQTSGLWFMPPPGVAPARICADSGERATPACPRTLEEQFLEERQPQGPCHLHGTGLPLPLPLGLLPGEHDHAS